VTLRKLPAGGVGAHSMPAVAAGAAVNNRGLLLRTAAVGCKTNATTPKTFLASQDILGGTRARDRMLAHGSKI
jgi:hypothetical protein